MMKGMAKPKTSITPANRLEVWAKLWAKPIKLDDETTEGVFEEFMEGLVPARIHKKFLQFFGTPRAAFGNRFFMDDAVFHNWDTKMSDLGAEEPLEVSVIYGVEDALEGYVLKGQTRRSLRDIVVDDWHASCAVVRSGECTWYVFVEPKMRGCIVRS